MASNQALVVRTFRLAKGIAVTVPKSYSVEPGTPLLVDKDQDGRISYTPLNLLKESKATESAT